LFEVQTATENDDDFRQTKDNKQVIISVQNRWCGCHSNGPDSAGKCRQWLHQQ